MASPSGELLLEVRDLRTHIDTKNGLVRAVDGVSFRLHAGETLGIIGESGSGKSMTALSTLQVVPKPAARIVGGDVLYRGENLLEKDESEMRRVRGREIAMILQDPQTSLNSVFTIGNQIVEALRIHRRNDGRKALVQRAVEALREVRIAAPEERIRSYPREMSGGMKQLCGRARGDRRDRRRRAPGRGRPATGPRTGAQEGTGRRHHRDPE